jgi:dihydrofolate reductase
MNSQDKELSVIISIIAAMTDNRVIGRDNAIPWHIPADMQRFRAITMGHPLIMGRKTFESIGRPLPGRKTVILTRSPDYRAEGCAVVHGLGEALDECRGADEVFICGGGEVFREAMPLASRIYLTVVHIDVEGDTYFPDIPGEFAEAVRENIEGTIPFSFILYERKNGGYSKPESGQA